MQICLTFYLHSNRCSLDGIFQTAIICSDTLFSLFSVFYTYSILSELLLPFEYTPTKLLRSHLCSDVKKKIMLGKIWKKMTKQILSWRKQLTSHILSVNIFKHISLTFDVSANRSNMKWGQSKPIKFKAGTLLMTIRVWNHAFRALQKRSLWKIRGKGRQVKAVCFIDIFHTSDT